MFNKIDKELESLFSGLNEQNRRYSEKDIERLPEPVHRYFEYSLNGKEKINSVRLEHGGRFRLKPEQGFKEIKGKEYFNARELGFIWKGKVPLFTAKDSYINGEGYLKVKLFSLIKVIDEREDKVNQGEA